MWKEDAMGKRGMSKGRENTAKNMICDVGFASRGPIHSILLLCFAVHDPQFSSAEFSPVQGAPKPLRERGTTADVQRRVKWNA